MRQQILENRIDSIMMSFDAILGWNSEIQYVYQDEGILPAWSVYRELGKLLQNTLSFLLICGKGM